MDTLYTYFPYNIHHVYNVNIYSSFVKLFLYFSIRPTVGQPRIFLGYDRIMLGYPIPFPIFLLKYP